MSGLRKHFTMGLALLLCTLTGHCGESAPSASPAPAPALAPAPVPVPVARDAQQRDLRRMAEIVRHVEDSRGRHGARTETPMTSRARTPSPAEAQDLRSVRTERGDQAVGEWRLVAWRGLKRMLQPWLQWSDASS